MKIALITDTHFGVHRNSEIFLQSSLKWFREELFPELERQNITDIYHLGDMFDNRNVLSIRVINEVINLIGTDGKKFNWTLLVGNHDSVYKTSILTNSLNIFRKFKNVKVVDSITKINVSNRDILLIPWQTNKEEFRKKVSDKNIFCDVAMGHLEVKGIYMNKGNVCEDGVEQELFLNNYALTFSGHFHKRSLTKSQDRVVQYIGNTYHLSRHDINEDRGFCVLDLDSLTYEFVNNKQSIKYTKLVYPEKVKKTNVSGNIVDVLVNINKDYDEKKFQSYLATVESFEPIIPPNVKIEHEVVMNKANNQEYKVQSILDLMNEYINELEIDYKDKVLEKIETLYENCKKEL
jgi:DNA repair exonuclease SbcCD nuclease subunit